jgi:hypothetical protein
MNALDEDRMKKLLQQALPPVDSDAAPGCDLWPAVKQRLDARPDRTPLISPVSIRWALLDWALLAGLMAFAAFLPASIPVFLYYL